MARSSRVRACAGLCAIVVLGGLAGAGEALAEPRPVQLAYEVGDGAGDCPTRDRLREAVNARLGYDPFEPDAAGTVTVGITARRTRYTALVRLTGMGPGMDGERRVQAEVRGCDELIEAVALSVSLALDPEAVERPKRPRRSPETATLRRERRGLAPSRPPPPTPPAEPVSAAPAASDGGWAMSARLGISAGGVPMPAPEVRLELRAEGGALAGGLELRAEAPVPRSVSGGQISAHLAGLTASGCARWRWLRGCALGTVGALTLHGVGLQDGRSHTEPYGSAGLRFGLAWPLGADLALDVTGDLEVPFVRVGALVGERVVWRAAPVAGAVSIGLGWRL